MQSGNKVWSVYVTLQINFFFCQKWGLETSSRPFCVYKGLTQPLLKTRFLKQADYIGYVIAKLKIYQNQHADFMRSFLHRIF